jgi:hypothetical protein
MVRCLALFAVSLSLGVPTAAVASPTAAVAMGDSAISGESAGNYEPGTDQPGNRCHRSLDALIHRTAIAGIEATLNLACSGARSANLNSPGGVGQNGEPSQADKLSAVAAAYDVKLVVVEIGANDDPQFAGVAADCIGQYVLRTGVGCRWTVGPLWTSRVNAMVPKVERALEGVQAVMTAAGYEDAAWDRVLASYWSPVPGAPIRYAGYLEKLWNGCPLYDADMAWGHDTAVPILSGALQGIASRKRWRFLDFSRSMDGREICARGITHEQEWTSGFRFAPSNAGGLNLDAVRESLHVNARGHAQLGRCVTEFAVRRWTQAACVRGDDGDLHAVP